MRHKIGIADLAILHLLHSRVQCCVYLPQIYLSNTPRQIKNTTVGLFNEITQFHLIAFFTTNELYLMGYIKRSNYI